MESLYNQIAPCARIGRNVRLGSYVTIEDGVELGDDCVVENYCYLGYRNGRERDPALRIGPGALIRSHSVIYAGSEIGHSLRTGHHVVIRENSRIGDGFQPGIGTVVMGEIEIGDHVRTASNAELGQFSTVGNCVWISRNTTLINDKHPPSHHIVGPSVEDYAILGAHCLVYPGVRVGEGSLLGSGCFLMQDLEPGLVAVGNPSRVIGRADAILMPAENGVRPAYPWRHRFHRGYPPELVAAWLAELEQTARTGEGAA